MSSISENFHSILYLEDRFNLLPKLSETFPQYTQDDSKKTLDYLKKVIKSNKNLPTVKLQALKVIESLMNSKNPFIISYCGKKFYNRFKVLASFQKESKSERRGANLFNSDSVPEMRSSEIFLISLLKNIKQWAVEFPLDNKGKSSNYCKLFNYLISKKVTFPDQKLEKEKVKVKNSLISIRKEMRCLAELISENKYSEKINEIGGGLSKYRQFIEKYLEKYLQIDEPDLIEDLTSTLFLLKDGNKALDSWRSKRNQFSFLDLPVSALPKPCSCLEDIVPKTLKEPDELSDSIQDIQIDLESPLPIFADKEYDEKEATFCHEWIGLGADYCKVKDKLRFAEESLSTSKQESEKYSLKLSEEKRKNEELEKKFADLTENSLKTEQQLNELISELSQKNLEICEKLASSESKNEDFERNLKQLEENEKNNKETIFNLESCKSELLEHVKFLEAEIEKHLESEKFLKNEIKELFKKLNQGSESPSFTQTEKSVSNLQSLSHLDLPTLEDDEQNELVYHQRLDNEFKTKGYSIARNPSNKLTHIDNLEYFKKLVVLKEGILFENLLVKISFSVQVIGLDGRATILIENTSKNDFFNVKTKLFSDPNDENCLYINSEQVDSLGKSQVEQKEIVFECKGIFQVFPMMKISFISEETKSFIILLLPICYSLFFEKPQFDLIKEWEKIEECCETVARTNIRSLKNLLRSLNFSQAFSSSYIEGGGVIIASHSPVGPVLAVVVLKNSSAVIQVKCDNLAIRDLINNMIVTQVLPSVS